MKTRTRQTGGEKGFAIRPYFLPPERARMSEITNAFTYETG
jgi:hypothetical protein